MDIKQYTIAIIKGDREVFRDFTDRNIDQIYGLIFKLVGDSFEAQDIVQEVFIKLWEKRKTLKHEYSLLSFTKKIAVNKSYDYLRKFKRTKMLDNQYETIDNISDFSADRKIEDDDYSKITDMVCSNLSAKQRMVFTLAALEGMNADEISKLTGMSKTRIKSNLYHARKTVQVNYRKLMQNE